MLFTGENIEKQKMGNFLIFAEKIPPASVFLQDLPNAISKYIC